MTLSAEYDHWHARRQASAPEHDDRHSPWYDLVREYIGSVKNKRILEIACGRGGFVKFLLSEGAEAFGADFSQVALGLAAAKCSHGGAHHGSAPLACADAQQLPFAGNSFDLVISCETIEHLLDPATALREMARVSREGGLLFLTTPNYLNAMGLYYLYARMRGRPATPGADQPTDRVFLFPQVRKMLKQSGWTIVHSDGAVHQFPVWPGRNPVLLPSLASNRTVRQILSPFAFHYFLMAERSHRS